MTVLPVMERELRAEARHALSYWLRTLGALVLLILFAVMMIEAQDNAPGLGAKLFGNLNTALFITIWLLVPLLTADCLSRERREGTLGILFLTPLTVLAFLYQTGLRDQRYWRWDSYAAPDLILAILVPCTFASLPIVGLYFSLSFKHFLGAWLSTLGVCVLLPMLLPKLLVLALALVVGSLANNPLGRPFTIADLIILMSGSQIVFALIAVERLYSNLRHRKFALAA